jgi:endonuclease/exonuclease/phosphatase family metal-dependent hydrolase
MSQSIIRKALFLGLFLICHPGLSKTSSPSVSPAGGRVATAFSLMSYNVENLFDTQKDPGKDDWTFLPAKTQGKMEACRKIRNPAYRRECEKVDWTQAHLALKIAQIKKYVTHDSKDALPDFLALIEVENDNVVSQLARELGYIKYVMTSSPDERGIDVALLFNENSLINFVDKKEHVIQGEHLNHNPTRNILEAKFNIGGTETLYVFVNHWPSQGNPRETRITAAETLRDRINSIKKREPKASFIAVGDFNTLATERPHPINDTLLKEGILVDAHTSFIDSKQISVDSKEQLSAGTYFYERGKEWNLLDHILFSNNMLHGSKQRLTVDLASYRIHAPSFALKNFRARRTAVDAPPQKIPQRYNFLTDKPDQAGFSDHLAPVIRLKLTP